MWLCVCVCVVRSGDGGRQDHQSEPVGHGGSGGVRPAEDAVVPADQRLHHLLLHLEPRLLRERQTQVAPRGQRSKSTRQLHRCLTYIQDLLMFHVI